MPWSMIWTGCALVLRPLLPTQASLVPLVRMGTLMKSRAGLQPALELHWRTQLWRISIRLLPMRLHLRRQPRHRIIPHLQMTQGSSRWDSPRKPLLRVICPASINRQPK